MAQASSSVAQINTCLSFSSPTANPQQLTCLFTRSFHHHTLPFEIRIRFKKSHCFSTHQHRQGEIVFSSRTLKDPVETIPHCFGVPVLITVIILSLLLAGESKALGNYLLRSLLASHCPVLLLRYFNFSPLFAKTSS